MSIHPLAIILPGLAVGVAATMVWPAQAPLSPWQVGALLCLAAQLKGRAGVVGTADMHGSMRQLLLDRQQGRWRMHPLSNLLGSIGIAMAVTSLVAFLVG